jgi:transcriptional regulator with XRE-family HTH domain
VVRVAREFADISQTEIARRTGIPQQAISAWERGVHEPSFSAVFRVIGACGLDLVALPVARTGPDIGPARVEIPGGTVEGTPFDRRMRLKRIRRAQARQYQREHPRRAKP